MRILLNATDGPLSLRAIKRYVFEMIKGLGHPESGVELELAFYTHRLFRVREFLNTLPRETQYKVHHFPLPRRWNNQRHLSSRFEIRRLERNIDLYHETTTDNPRFTSTPVLTTVHGLCAVVRPDILGQEFTAGKSAWFNRAMTHSDYLTTVSETSQRELHEHFDFPRERVRSIPLGVSAQYSPGDPQTNRAAAQDLLGMDSPYVLYVGGIQHNKNIVRVLSTFKRLVEEGLFDGKLVLAGDLMYSLSEFRALVEREGIADHVILTGCFDQADPRLATLYRGACLFLFPSFYEGWTSPPLEAMASGVPVIASSASSIPETVGYGGRLADPHDGDEWFRHAAELMTQPKVRREMVEAGLARAAEYPWSRCIGSCVGYYQDILSGSITTSSPNILASVSQASSESVL